MIKKSPNSNFFFILCRKILNFSLTFHFFIIVLVSFYELSTIFIWFHCVPYLFFLFFIYFFSFLFFPLFSLSPSFLPPHHPEQSCERLTSYTGGSKSHPNWVSEFIRISVFCRLRRKIHYRLSLIEVSVGSFLEQKFRRPETHQPPWRWITTLPERKFANFLDLDLFWRE